MINERKNARVVLDRKEISVEVGTRVLDIVRSAGIESPCAGHGRCGKCKVRAEGVLSPMEEAERSLLKETEIKDGIRLACFTRIMGDAVIDCVFAKRDSSVLLTGIKEVSVGVPFFEKYGVAIDIGTTTLAASLYNKNGENLSLLGEDNPQGAFGADVISRIEAALAGRAEELSLTIRKALSRIIERLADSADISTRDIDGAVITGNTVMLSLLTNTSVEPLSHAPFEPLSLFGEECTAGTIGITALSDETRIYLPRCIAGFVGADITSAVLASGMCKGGETALLVDIGTNGEIALYKNGALTVASSAAGPAFEGAGITMGMRAAPGAIDKVTVANDRLLVHTVDDKKPVGICGSGLVDAVAALLTLSELDECGYLEDESFEIAKGVVITQKDIRAVQVAKSAICAGIKTLLYESDTDFEEVKTLYIAGGFGSYLDYRNAAAIGLIPRELSDKVSVIGNAALAGASIHLLGTEAGNEIASIIENAAHTELSTSKVFSEEYMMGMMFGE